MQYQAHRDSSSVYHDLYDQALKGSFTHGIWI